MEKLKKFGGNTPFGRSGQPAELVSGAAGGGGQPKLNNAKFY